MSVLINFEAKNLIATFDINSLKLTVNTGYKQWSQKQEFEPYFKVKLDQTEKKVFFNEAGNINSVLYKTGVGEGVKSSFSGFEIDGEELDVAFTTLIWVDYTYGKMHFELVPVKECKYTINSIAWPAPIEFDKLQQTSYTVLPIMQGLIIPNNWEHDIDIDKVKDIENGKFYTRSSYMPWWGQIEDGAGYIAIAETPWDGGYILKHSAGGPTVISPEWHSSLGNTAYERKIICTFLNNCDYNDLCKIYRKYVKEKGSLATLKEKSIKNERINSLIGTPVVHTSIYIHTEPTSYYYDRDNLENNDILDSFKKRSIELDRLKDKGIDCAFVHVDGWGIRGYDNLHPDVFPPCEKAGGWDGMRLLSNTCSRNGYFFATHDQYRDYYADADTFNEDQAVKNAHGEVPYESIWCGGLQAFLCTKLAPEYVKRNFELLKENGVILTGTYLDVFSVVGLDECFDAEHKMTRKECMEKRMECFNYVRSEGIIVSSEESVDWAVPGLDLVYRSNYVLEPDFNKGIPIGIPVPLFNLVYHDCIIVPWYLAKGGYEIPECDNGLLHALLNGSTCYLNIDADDDEIKKSNIVCELHKRVATCEMIKHEFIDGNIRRQRTIFSDGTTVEVDFDADEYKILSN